MTDTEKMAKLGEFLSMCTGELPKTYSELNTMLWKAFNTGRLLVDFEPLLQKVDLRTCKHGDKLLMRDGQITNYDRYDETLPYPHIVNFTSDYADCGKGSRCDNGQVFTHDTHKSDIIKILGQ